jgi:hypothetical protein
MGGQIFGGGGRRARGTPQLGPSVVLGTEEGGLCTNERNAAPGTRHAAERQGDRVGPRQIWGSTHVKLAAAECAAAAEAWRARDGGAARGGRGEHAGCDAGNAEPEAQHVSRSGRRQQRQQRIGRRFQRRSPSLGLAGGPVGAAEHKRQQAPIEVGHHEPNWSDP